jgi:hypothetical protein
VRDVSAKIFKGPLFVFTVFSKITEVGPLHIYASNRTVKINLLVTYARNFPVTLARPTIDTYFPADIKWIRLKNDNFMPHLIISYLSFSQNLSVSFATSSHPSQAARVWMVQGICNNLAAGIHKTLYSVAEKI